MVGSSTHALVMIPGFLPVQNTLNANPKHGGFIKKISPTMLAMVLERVLTMVMHDKGTD